MIKLHTLQRGMFFGVILSTVVVSLLQWTYRNEPVSNAYAADVITTSRGAYPCPSIDKLQGHEMIPYSEPVQPSLEPMQVNSPDIAAFRGA